MTEVVDPRREAGCVSTRTCTGFSTFIFPVEKSFGSIDYFKKVRISVDYLQRHLISKY